MPSPVSDFRAVVFALGLSGMLRSFTLPQLGEKTLITWRSGERILALDGGASKQVSQASLASSAGGFHLILGRADFNPRMSCAAARDRTATSTPPPRRVSRCAWVLAALANV